MPINTLFAVRKCGCPPEQALLGDSCRKCDELRLSCPSPGTDALLAQPLPGYVRLGNRPRAFECIFPSTRCRASLLNASTCNDGYMGNMCMECRPGFYSRGKLCKQCMEVSSFPTFRSLWQSPAVAVAVIAVVAALVLTLAVFWIRRRFQNAQSDRPTSLTMLQSQLKAQLPLLLQMGFSVVSCELQFTWNCQVRLSFVLLPGVLHLPIVIRFGIRQLH